MTLPRLTSEQRRRALAKAAESRRNRAAFLKACKAGSIPPETAIDAPVGPNRAKAAMEDIGIAESRRVGGLGSRQRERVLAFLAGKGAGDVD